MQVTSITAGLTGHLLMPEFSMSFTLVIEGEPIAAEPVVIEDEIETVSICKKGRLTQAQHAREHTGEFQDGQRFRSGIEGSISVLKRAFRLKRCFFVIV